MAVKYYVSVSGEFIGAFVGGAVPPESSTEVPSPPEMISQIWNFANGTWGAPAVVVPEIVTMRQARLALLGGGYLDAVEAALSAMEGPAGQAARIEWNHSSEVHRYKPFVVSIGAGLGMSAKDMDDLFIAAAQIG